MVARLIDLADPDASSTLYGSLEEAKEALELMRGRYTSQGYTVTEEIIPGEDFPQYKIVDPSDEWVGTYTIILD